MKVIDIRSRNVKKNELPEKPGTHFQVHVEEIKREEQKGKTHHALEVGREEMPGSRPSVAHPFKLFWAFLKSIRLVRFSFITPFGLKKYRVHISFIIASLLLFILVSMAGLAGNVLFAKQELLSEGKRIVQELGQGGAQGIPAHLFDASLLVKDANKHLVSLGKVPELLAKLPFGPGQSVAKGTQAISEGSVWAELFLRLAGFYEPRYYLVLFQNNAEIRPTGGFIGSYSLLKVYRGQVEIKRAENVFNFSGQQSLLLTPPLPIQKISENWTFHDLNWFFDFPTSARLLAWMYEKVGGPTVDGVIAITPKVAEDVLALTGPIEMPEYNLTFTKDNFFDLLQYEVEENFKARGLEDPKSIIGDLTPKLVSQLLSSNNASAIGELIVKSLAEKDILAYLADTKEQSFLFYQNWAGGISQQTKDYLAVVNTNINGYKTDRVIDQHVSLHTTFEESGDIIHTVSVTRRHNGGDEPYDWYNKVNANFLRVYVPKGAELLDAHGQTLEFRDPRINYQKAGFRQLPILEDIEHTSHVDEATGTRIYEETGKTVFANWAYVSPKEEVEVVYTYKVPSAATTFGEPYSYLLTVQKQPGITSSFSWDVEVPDDFEILWQSSVPKLLNTDTQLGLLVANTSS